MKRIKRFNIKKMPLFFSLLLGAIIFAAGIKTDVIAKVEENILGISEDGDYLDSFDEMASADAKALEEERLRKEENKRIDEELRNSGWTSAKRLEKDVPVELINDFIEPGTVINNTVTEIILDKVDEDYFKDALFIGDSRTDGLRAYGSFDGATYVCATGMSVFKILDDKDLVKGYNGLLDFLRKKKFGKVYIMLGTNEYGYEEDAYIKKFGEFVDIVRKNQPDAIIYIQSILYATINYEKKYHDLETDGVNSRNAKLKEMANDEDIFYLEVNDCLNDGTDHLPSEYTGDGVHLYAKYYPLWRDYLLNHAAVTVVKH